MRYYFFSIVNNSIHETESGAKISALEYHHYENNDGGEPIFYKLTDGKISHIICEAKDQDSATKAVEKYLSGL